MTRKAAMERLEEFAEIEGKLGKLREKHERELDELTAAAREKFGKKTTPLAERRAEIEAELIGYLEAKGIDQMLSAGGAVAEQRTETKTGRRVIEPKKFFDAVKTKGAEFWGCLAVQIAKAEKFMGATEVDRIAEKTEKTEVVRTVRMG